jgi:hypothetical protein
VQVFHLVILTAFTRLASANKSGRHPEIYKNNLSLSISNLYLWYRKPKLLSLIFLPFITAKTPEQRLCNTTSIKYQQLDLYLKPK